MPKLLLQVQKEEDATLRVYTRNKVNPSEISKMFADEVVDTSRIFGPIEVPTGEEPGEGLQYYYIIKLLPDEKV